MDAKNRQLDKITQNDFLYSKEILKECGLQELQGVFLRKGGTHNGKN
jgi:hypothetical protein